MQMCVLSAVLLHSCNKKETPKKSKHHKNNPQTIFPACPKPRRKKTLRTNKQKLFLEVSCHFVLFGVLLFCCVCCSCFCGRFDRGVFGFGRLIQWMWFFVFVFVLFFGGKDILLKSPV